MTEAPEHVLQHSPETNKMYKYDEKIREYEKKKNTGFELTRDGVVFLLQKFILRTQAPFKNVRTMKVQFVRAVGHGGDLRTNNPRTGCMKGEETRRRSLVQQKRKGVQLAEESVGKRTKVELLLKKDKSAGRNEATKESASTNSRLLFCVSIYIFMPPTFAYSRLDGDARPPNVQFFAPQ